jgi:Domain of unknown function (DUF1707)
MAAESGVRIGDAEREKVATSLREHYASGRLTLDEFQQRLDAVFAAKTATDLAKITADLPHTDPYAAPWPPSQPFSTPTSGYPIGAGQSQSYQRCGSRPFSYARVFLALCALAALLIVSFSLPFGAPKFLIILLGILAFCRRIFRRIGGGRR